MSMMYVALRLRSGLIEADIAGRKLRSRFLSSKYEGIGLLWFAVARLNAGANALRCGEVDSGVVTHKLSEQVPQRQPMQMKAVSVPK